MALFVVGGILTTYLQILMDLVHPSECLICTNGFNEYWISRSSLLSKHFIHFLLRFRGCIHQLDEKVFAFLEREAMEEV